MTPQALVEDYPSSDDDKDTTVQTPPASSHSFSPPPFQEIDMDDASESPDGMRTVRHLPDIAPLSLPPISGPSSKGLTLPPVQPLIDESRRCRECEEERVRRASWDDEHGRAHPEHALVSDQRRPSSPHAHAHARPQAIALDTRRHTVHGPLATHPHYYCPYPPPVSYAYVARQRYPSQVPFPVPRRTPTPGPLYDYDDRADAPRYVLEAPYACAPHGRAPPSRRPSINFDGFTLSPRQPSPGYTPLEPIVDPRDATFSTASDERRAFMQAQAQSWRRTHVDSAAPRRASHDARALASPPPPLSAVARRESFSRAADVSPHLASVSARRDSNATLARRDSTATKPRRRSNAQHLSRPSTHEGAELVPEGAPKREASEASDVGVPRARGPLERPQPFTDAQISALGERFLLELHPRRTKLECRWAGGCGAAVPDPLTANVVAHLADAHGVCARERSEAPVVCRWGACGRTLKACSLRNHILNCHEKAKTGECRLCGALISRAETYLMHRHLTSCLNKIARAGRLEERLRAVGVEVCTDPATGEITFGSASASEPRTLVEDDAYDELDDEA